MEYTTTHDGVRIAYDVQGDGASTLVLLAGQANSHRWWDGVRDDFHGVRRTVALDYRGTGESDKPDTPYSTEVFARDVIAVLDALGVDRADVYGTSMGGRVAQQLAARHPDRVGALVLGCTSPGGPHGVERGDDVRKSLARPQPQARRALLELMYTPDWLATRPGPYHTLGDPGMPAHARRRHLAASDRHDTWDLLPGITAPTLVLHGSDDLLNPTANALLLAHRIPGARLHLIPGARHAYFEEFRSVASPLVLDFLATVP
ncbi:alpha/beta fold hydrolase [Streptantibioticus cattleyicolor]|uniref:Hydrolase or acyltransferase (Alpha/beta hydrolase superfamily)-like protein n=1 Tax=Streptantibioticus cattleyicolor (strain ATCC 35852 / DSM 46488 / JCM 4925 / NBRC 14057 / NRRL 8057) TaxID=1003195 RepID=F8JKX6_STREN|nr:alpha/beta fold hydrolase [Streptantibioticus cattleyicolor]AEW99668.1 hydrolase or acyltransferase (alpha/beta hydrolase superfamily)-like protein [Streptantibioticus cattleyicolor NRRL 8057 = DSM 46488]CCB71293.1 Predicted hydrolase or acyltransferase of alpha/beta superfamily [Streptantibioticus cattleyicolor NRRL 8057 = DSM 46488]